MKNLHMKKMVPFVELHTELRMTINVKNFKNSFHAKVFERLHSFGESIISPWLMKTLTHERITLSVCESHSVKNLCVLMTGK